MYNLTNFSQSEADACEKHLRTLGSGSTSMEETANRIVRYWYDNLGPKKDGRNGCALVRFYKTHPYRELEPDLKQFARGILGQEPESPAMRCLTLLATAGDKSEWNYRTRSVGHKAIPLPSEKVVAQIPMIAQLVHQFGLEVSALLKPAPDLLVDLEQKSYNVFHVPKAEGSPYIPAQKDFVVPAGIQSVLGFGGMLSSGDLYAVILFSKVSIARETADRFKGLAGSLREAVKPFVGGTVFGRAQAVKSA